MSDPQNRRSPVGKFIDLVVGAGEEKRLWRIYVRRVKTLPSDYRLVMKHIEKFLWTYAADSQMIPVLEGILERFEGGAAKGRPFLEITGDDVAGFALNVLNATQANTWTGKKAEQLNTAVRKALGQRQTQGQHEVQEQHDTLGNLEN
jgi:DNA-binding ferritin-like protein (Dps family)